MYLPASSSMYELANSIIPNKKIAMLFRDIFLGSNNNKDPIEKV